MNAASCKIIYPKNVVCRAVEKKLQQFGFEIKMWGGVLQRSEDRALQHCSTAACGPGSRRSCQPTLPPCSSSRVPGRFPLCSWCSAAVGWPAAQQWRRDQGQPSVQCRSGYSHTDTVEYITHSDSIEILNHSSFSYFLFWNRKKVRQKSLGIVGQLLKYQVSENWSFLFMGKSDIAFASWDCVID